MSKVFFEDDGMRTMKRFLDLAVQRQSLISSNVANVDTPGYQTVDVSFEQELQNAASAAGTQLHTTNGLHLSVGTENSAKAMAKAVAGLPVRNDLNNVNVDREMAQLSTNALKFSMVAQFLVGKFRTLKAAIQEGR
jgi:flagellar basal-body rod protein FlgB